MRILCPRCKTETKYDPTNAFRPFCSERCQTIDFGAWATEQYAVPAEEVTMTLNMGSQRDESDYDQDDNGELH